MTPRFTKFCDGFVLDWECDWPSDTTGQLSNDPSDPGGLTRWGIDKRDHPTVDVRNLTHDQALGIYYQEWVGEGVEKMPPRLGEAYFDACVNCGVKRAQQFQAGAARVDQVIDAREAFYRRLANARPVLKKYLKGWLNRTTDLRNYLSNG